MTETSALFVQNLSKRYGAVTALTDFEITLKPGHITSLLGASGAGKSTLLRLIAGLEYPSSGEIRTHDKVLSTPEKIIPPEKRGIGLIFQDFALFPNMTASQNVMFGLKSSSSAEKKDHAIFWLETLGIASKSDAYPHQLSGGEQQRVAIARAIAAKPTAIMMDEPFSGLDPSNRDFVRTIALNAIREARIPALLVTHDPEEALAHADQVSILDEGRLLQTGSPDDLYLRPASKTVASAFGILNTVNQSDLPEPWKPLISDASATLYYRPEAIDISDNDVSVPLQIKAMRRIGASHAVDGIFENGISITFITILPAQVQLNDTIRVRPRPELFYPF